MGLRDFYSIIASSRESIGSGIRARYSARAPEERYIGANQFSYGMGG